MRTRSGGTLLQIIGGGRSGRTHARTHVRTYADTSATRTDVDRYRKPLLHSWPYYRGLVVDVVIVVDHVVVVVVVAAAAAAVVTEMLNSLASHVTGSLQLVP